MSSEKIMVVEDEWVVADQLCRDLKELGYTVCQTASTGDEAIRKAEADRPDLILMDIVLKGKMDGIEAAGRIKSQFNIPVLYLTATALVNDAGEMYAIATTEREAVKSDQ